MPRKETPFMCHYICSQYHSFFLKFKHFIRPKQFKHAYAKKKNNSKQPKHSYLYHMGMWNTKNKTLYLIRSCELR